MWVNIQSQTYICKISSSVGCLIRNAQQTSVMWVSGSFQSVLMILLIWGRLGAISTPALYRLSSSPEVYDFLECPSFSTVSILAASGPFFVRNRVFIDRSAVGKLILSSAYRKYSLVGSAAKLWRSTHSAVTSWYVLCILLNGGSGDY